jgi:OPT family oligopeptide transporter
MAEIDLRNPPNEMPDIVGYRPSNPLAANFRPYISAATRMRELTPVPLIVGTLLGVIFGASSLYLVLKVGLTVSASIPVAVISITLFRLFSKFGMRDATILENNIVQTAGSAGESIAFGLGVTMPAIMILGFDLEITRVMLVAVLGGLLGILMMIPLRRALIVDQHGLLKYPEGTACAEVLKAAASREGMDGGTTAVSSEFETRTGQRPSLQPNENAPVDDEAGGGKTIFSGFGLGFLYYTAMEAFKAWKEVPEKIFGAPFKAGSISLELNPALLGVGYIIGPRIASIMCGGGVLAYLVLIPAIKFFGEGATGILAPGTMPIGQMAPDDIREAYVLYIGAGAVAAGGIISMVRSLPLIWHGMKSGFADLQKLGGESVSKPARTDQDLSMKFVIGGVIAILLAIMIAPQLHLQWNLLGALLIVVIGFLFTTVSSHLTGEIGSSSCPTSGMTVATLLLTCLVFLIVGWTGPHYFVTALSIGGIVCIASSNGGTTSQDLKTGFLVGSTPRLQQIAILAGSLASALALGPILLGLNNSYTVYVPPTTFQKIEAGATPPRVQAPNLRPFQEKIKPDTTGHYRVLHNEKGGVNSVIPGLNPGDYLVNEEGEVVYKLEHNFPSNLRAPNEAELGPPERVRGAQATTDPQLYRSWQRSDPNGGAAQRFLVNNQREAIYLVDPGINGTHKIRPDGSTVTKFDAPKATLMSYIIKGILGHKLPWALVLLGVMISIVLEMSGIPSLAFAVGVYLPLSSSTPIFVGGMLRWLVDRWLRRHKFKEHDLTHDELVAEGDKSSGVLLASGYIAGSAITGIIIALMNLVPSLAATSDRLTAWATAHNPFFAGPHADLLALIPFVVLCVLLYLVGRDVLLAPRKTGSS